MPIVPLEGRITMAESITMRPVHCAWGLGDGAWIVPPAENNNATTLTQEIGRRTPNEVTYAAPDDSGTITLPDGSRFSRSPVPTNHLLVVVNFELGDAPGAVIREFAIFVGSTMVPDLPLGQVYFKPVQILEPGRILHLEHLTPIYLGDNTTQSFSTVITV